MTAITTTYPNDVRAEFDERKKQTTNCSIVNLKTKEEIRVKTIENSNSKRVKIILKLLECFAEKLLIRTSTFSFAFIMIFLPNLKDIHETHMCIIFFVAQLSRKLVAFWFQARLTTTDSIFSGSYGQALQIIVTPF